MAKHDAMIIYQRSGVDQRLLQMRKSVEELEKFGAKFSSLTKYIHAVASRMGDLDGKRIHASNLIRNDSPYKAELVKAFNRSQKRLIKFESDAQERLELRIALSEKDTLIEGLHKRIEGLLTENIIQKNKYEQFVTDKPNTAAATNEPFFSYIQTLLHLFCEPVGVYIFDPYAKQIIDPGTDMAVMKDFPDGFIEWYLKNQR